VTGAKLRDFFDRYIDGLEPLPYDRLLPQIGLKIVVDQEKQATLGAQVESVEQGWRVLTVDSGGTAYATGLRAGDVLTKMHIGPESMEEGNLPLTEVPATVVDQLLEQLPTYIPATITLLRDGRESKLPVKYVLGSVDVYRAAIDENASPAAAAVRRSMFGF
jgi:hypothetical protein